MLQDAKVIIENYLFDKTGLRGLLCNKQALRIIHITQYFLPIVLNFSAAERLKTVKNLFPFRFVSLQVNINYV